MTDWRKWRLTYDGGDEFREIYLEKFSGREDQSEFNARKQVTPVPRFAGAAINDIRNAIYQRMRDITRKGGSKTYQNAVNGLNLGVDRRGSTMNAFVGVKVLTELLVMGRVGVFVDAPLVPPTATLANTGNVAPYLYRYDIEDILSWTCSKPEEPSEFQAVLLRDTVMQFDQSYFLPTVQVQRYRYLWINPDTGKVNLQFYDIQGSPVDQFGQPSGAVELELTRIPFVMLDIGNSLIKDVCGHQIALLEPGFERRELRPAEQLPVLHRAEGLAGGGCPPEAGRHGGRHGHHRRPRRGRDGHPGRRDPRPVLRQGNESAGLHQPVRRTAAGQPGLAGPAQAGHPRTGQPGGLGVGGADLGRVEGDGQPGP